MAVPFAQEPRATAFSSPASAVESLVQAVQSSDTGAIQRVLGESTDLASSGDPNQDKLDRELFIAKYEQMHRLHRDADGTVTLYIGAENWPFPVPLAKHGGAWRFDVQAGEKEVLFRRIGENELKAVEACQGRVAAKAPSASAAADIPIDGYYFRVLTLASGRAGTPTTAAVAVLAYPAEYGQTGVMTFVITRNGAIYEKDLGANTSLLAGTLASFHQDAGWRRVTD